MKTPDNFITPTKAAEEWGVTRSWLWQVYKRGEFKDYEIYETPFGTLFSREGLHRVLGEPQPGRVAPNAGKRGARKDT